MGWFWAESSPSVVAAPSSGHPPMIPGQEPPPGCPMHKKTADALSSAQPKRDAPSSSGCPVPHGSSSSSSPPSSCPVNKTSNEASQPKSVLSQLNPLNYMFPDLSHDRAPNQTHDLPTSREESTIPKGSGDGNWEYPSPQQMYNAMLRKGYTDTDVTAVESMVAVHNYLNEGAWDEIRGWEARFGKGLWKGWQVCKRGEEHTAEEVERNWEGNETEPTLVRFQGRPGEMTPKATVLQMLGKLYPSKFGMEAPFDRHDWYVSREHNGEKRQVRYVIDYYSGEPDPNGDPVFYLDVRPAATPLGTAERFIRWGTDTWWKAIGGEERETNPKPFFRYGSAKPWG